MKTLNLFLRNFSLLILSILIISSCSKEEISNDNTILINSNLSKIEARLASDIQVVNGVLVFKDDYDYKATLLALEQMSNEEIINWENEIGFNSMHSTFQEIIMNEWNHTETGHSEIYLDALDQELIKVDGDRYEANIFNPGYIKILNNQGMVQIGNDIIQMTNDKFKIWNNGDIDHLSTLNSAISDTENIDVYLLNSNGIETRWTNYNWNDEFIRTGNKSRFILTGNYYSDHTNPAFKNIIFIKYLITARTELRTSFGWKIDPHAKTKIKGSSHTILEFSDGTNPYKEDITGSYYLSSIGGYQTIIPIEAGIHKLDEPMYFTRPGYLKNCRWIASSISSANEQFNGSISKS